MPEFKAYISLAAVIIGAALTLVVQALLAWRQRGWELQRIRFELFREEQARRIALLGKIQDILSTISRAASEFRDAGARVLTAIRKVQQEGTTGIPKEELDALRSDVASLDRHIHELAALARDYGTAPTLGGFKGEDLGEILGRVTSRLMVQAVKAMTKLSEREDPVTAFEAIGQEYPWDQGVSLASNMIRQLKGVEASILEQAKPTSIPGQISRQCA